MKKKSQKSMMHGFMQGAGAPASYRDDTNDDLHMMKELEHDKMKVKEKPDNTMPKVKKVSPKDMSKKPVFTRGKPKKAKSAPAEKGSKHGKVNCYVNHPKESGNMKNFSGKKMHKAALKYMKKSYE